jgi:hypothetical protein
VRLHQGESFHFNHFWLKNRLAANSIVEPAQTSAPTGFVNLLALPLIAILGLFAPTEKHQNFQAGTAVSKVIGKLIGFAITTVC